MNGGSHDGRYCAGRNENTSTWTTWKWLRLGDVGKLGEMLTQYAPVEIYDREGQLLLT